MWEYFLGFFAFLKVYRGIILYKLKRNRRRSTIMKGAEPFFHKGGRTGVLLIHGFTASPQEMRELGQYLAGKGLTVRCPLLMHHGTVPEELINAKLGAWMSQISREINDLRKHCDRIYLAGSSFGGNLALLQASEKEVAGIITYGTPIFWKRERFKKLLYIVINQFKTFQKKKHKFKKGSLMESVIKEKVHYERIPLIAISQVLRGAKKSKKALKSITAPILIVQSTSDRMVDNRTPPYIHDNVKSEVKKMLWVNDSYHVVLVDKHKKKVFSETYEFINSTSDQAANDTTNSANLVKAK